MSLEFSFGKYKGKSVSDIIENDLSYCRWLSNQTLLLESNPRIREALEKALSNDDGSYIICWGKYKGKTLKTIQAIDPNYITWLDRNAYVSENCPGLKEELKSIL